MPKIKLKDEELECHLKEQISFLKRSIASFDQGYLDEAKRIAVVVRVLVHDTEASKSLLGLLNLKNIDFFDTAPDYTQNIIGSFNGLALLEGGGPKGGRFVPRCLIPGNPAKPYTFKPFGEWWQKTVIVDNKNQKFSRQKIILALANKEGGAHIDPELDADYFALSKNNSMGWFYIMGDETGPVRNIEFVSCRQIAEEIIVTLKKARSDLFS
jgi:hypothetical protein